MENSALPALAVILSLALGCGAFFNQPPDKFSDNNLLMCYVTNPQFGTGRDQPARILEDPPPLIPLQQLSEFDQVWVPVSSGYPLPHLEASDTASLAAFLGNDLQIRFQSLDEILTTPPSPCPEDSNVDQDDLDEVRNRTSPFVSDELRICLDDYFTRVACPLGFAWTPLPKTFFPRWFVGGFCPSSSCSVPFGSLCAPNVSVPDTNVYTVLRWDCCWSLQETYEWKWECGWRKVRFPIVCDCDCGCGAVLQPYIPED